MLKKAVGHCFSERLNTPRFRLVIRDSQKLSGGFVLESIWSSPVSRCCLMVKFV